MLNLTYIGQNKKYPVNFRIISEHIVEVTGDFPILDYGFILTRIGDSNAFTGDYSLYGTVYRLLENGAQFSDDGSEYIPPEPKPTPVPVEPTLEEVRANKLSEIESTKNQSIMEGVEYKGTIFTYSTSEQFTIKNKLEQSIQTESSVSISGVLLNPEEIKELYTMLEKNEIYHTLYAEQLTKFVNSLEVKELIQEVYYGQELWGEYLEQFNSKYEEEVSVIESFVAQLHYANVESVTELKTDMDNLNEIFGGGTKQ